MRLNTFRIASAMMLAATSLMVACNLGDDYYDGFPIGTGGGRPFTDASAPGSGNPTTTACHYAKANGACTSMSPSVCEAKTGANMACNRLLRCDYDRWKLEEPETSCASECPTAYVTDLPDGCAAPNAGTLLCEYPQGTCGCAPVRPSVSDGGDAGDAGDDTEGGDTESDADAGPTAYVWTCVTPAAGCPRTRPAAGSECVRPLRCQYGDCVFTGGVTMSCSNGAWAALKQCDLPKDDL